MLLGKLLSELHYDYHEEFEGEVDSESLIYEIRLDTLTNHANIIAAKSDKELLSREVLEVYSEELEPPEHVEIVKKEYRDGLGELFKDLLTGRSIKFEDNSARKDPMELITIPNLRNVYLEYNKHIFKVTEEDLEFEDKENVRDFYNEIKRFDDGLLNFIDFLFYDYEQNEFNKENI